jgi:hypothetical protein
MDRFDEIQREDTASRALDRWSLRMLALAPAFRRHATLWAGQCDT